MATILFSDILGTLISENLIAQKNRYPNYQKEFDVICRIINIYLKDENYLVLVTDCDTHCTFDTMLNDILFNLQRRIDDEFKDRFLFFTMGSYQNIKKEDKIQIQKKDGLIHLINKDGVESIVIDGKTDAIDIVLKDINSKDLLIRGLGNETSDLDMLAKIIDLGGKSSVVYDYLNNHSISGFGDPIIKEYFTSTAGLIISSVSRKYRTGRLLDFNPFTTKEWNEYEEWVKKEKEKIYGELREGNLDIESLFLKTKLIKMIYDYEQINSMNSTVHQYQKNYQVSNIRKYIDDLSLFPSFEKYSQEVLGIHPNHGKM